MKTEKEFNEAKKLIQALVNIYPYSAEECQNNKGGPCSRCKAVLKAKKFLSDK